LALGEKIKNEYAKKYEGVKINLRWEELNPRVALANTREVKIHEIEIKVWQGLKLEWQNENTSEKEKKKEYVKKLLEYEMRTRIEQILKKRVVKSWEGYVRIGMEGATEV